MSTAVETAPSTGKVSEELADALAAGLRGVESSRRVGWAKAFEAIRRVEALEEEVRQLRDERKYLRRAYSRLLGLIQGVPFESTPIVEKELAAHFAAERSFRHQDAWDKGFKIAEDHIAALGGMSDQDLVGRRVRRLALAAAHKQVGREGRRLGHIVEESFDDAGRRVPVSCSCGERFPQSGRRSRQTALLDHLSVLTTGKPFADLYRDLHAEFLDKRIEGSKA